MEEVFRFVIEYCLLKQKLPLRDEIMKALDIPDEELIDLEDQNRFVRILLNRDQMLEWEIMKLINEPDIDVNKLTWGMATVHLELLGKQTARLMGNKPCR